MIKRVTPILKDARMPRRKTLKKLGTLYPGFVESTPVIWKDRLFRFEWDRPEKWLGDPADYPHGYYRFIDAETWETTPQFAEGHAFGCCYTDGDKMYVYGPKEPVAETHGIDMFVSSDLKSWEMQEDVIRFPDDITVFNTSVCACPGGYMMAIEIGGKNPVVGVAFTIVFAKSSDLKSWELLPMEEHIYAQERYTACPVLRWYDGYFYMIYLESAPYHRWLPYIVRSADLREFDPGLTNPIMYPSDEDKQILFPERLTALQIDRIENAINTNNSDIDLCNYNDKTVIMYSWGNQLGHEFLALAEYDGSEEEFLKSFF